MAEQLSSKREAASSKVRKEYYSSKKKQRRSDVALTLGENEALKTIQEGKTGEIQFVALSKDGWI
jgi:ribosomal protein L7Ae-like RNA K-turn-binding protein